MIVSDFKRLKELLVHAADLPEDERNAYLAEACKDDPDLLHKLESILSHDTDPASILKSEGVMPLGLSDGLIGQTIGHYRIVDQLGFGGMGVVYRACDTRLSREVALKVLTRISRALSGQALARFRREAEAASQIDHPGICKVYDIVIYSIYSAGNYKIKKQ